MPDVTATGVACDYIALVMEWLLVGCNF